MTDNVQCPVCTLYLHAGMNLSDHLETHPKEQVIKALVQLTISKVGDGDSLAETAALSAALNADNINTGQLCTTKVEEDSGSTIIKEEPQHKHPINISSNECKTNGAEPTSDADKSKQQKQAYQQNVGEPSTSTTFNAEFVNYAANNRYQQSSQTATFNSVERNQTDIGGLLTAQQHHHMSRSLLPPPPPPLPPSTATASTVAQSQLHHNTTAIPYNNIQQKQQIQQQHALLTHRQVSQTTAATQQSSNLKIIYSSTLPPPPPLQVSL